MKHLLLHSQETQTEFQGTCTLIRQEKAEEGVIIPAPWPRGQPPDEVALKNRFSSWQFPWEKVKEVTRST